MDLIPNPPVRLLRNLFNCCAVEDLEGAVEDLESKIKCTDDMIARLVLQIEGKIEKMESEAKSKYTQHGSAVEDLEVKIKCTYDVIAQLGEGNTLALGDLKKTIKSRDDEIVRLQELMHQIEGKIEEMESEVKDKYMEIKSAVEELEGKVEELEAEIKCEDDTICTPLPPPPTRQPPGAPERAVKLRSLSDKLEKITKSLKVMNANVGRPLKKSYNADGIISDANIERSS